MHFGAIIAFHFFSWPAFWAGVGLAVFTCQFGITLCYHRLLAHRSYKVTRWLEVVLTLAGCLAFQAGPIAWVATHRFHHKHADDEMDPHSPKVSFFWSHIGWTVFRHPELDTLDGMKRLCPDLAPDPVFFWLQRYFVAVNLAAAALLWSLGLMLGGWSLGLSMLLWAFCVRVVLIWHVTFLVNSASHVWGYQSYDTRDRSRNNWWVALLTFGEGWHNNHHADPRSAAHGREWWEFDMTYRIIRSLAAIGLASDVVRPSPRLSRLRPAGTKPGSH